VKTRRRYRVAGCSLAAIFGLLLAMVPISQSAYAAPSSVTCEGTISAPQDIPGGTYASFIMPPGSVCGIVGDVTVTSGVNIGAVAALVVASGSLHVEGPVRVGPGGSFGDYLSAAPISIGGALRVDHNATVAIGLPAPYGPLLSFITGAVRATDPSSIQIHNTEVGGPVEIRGGGGPNPIFAAAGIPYPGYNINDLEDNVIQGPVSQTHYDGKSSSILRNVMARLTFVKNSEASIGSNLINGPARCSGNHPAPNLGPDPGAPSIVHGPTRGDQAGTCTGVAGGVSGPPVSLPSDTAQEALPGV
jgi:hypothetical protein